MSAYSIGEAARRSGVKVPTIRYYEQVGLLPQPSRHDNNRRVYDDSAVARLSFIKHARSLGFEPGDISTLLELREKPNKSCSEADRIARAHLDDIDRRIKELKTLRGELKGMIDGCDQQRIASCQIIEGLNERPCETCAAAA